MAKILLVEDDEATCQMVQDWLTADHHTVDIAHEGEEGWYLASNYEYELLVLDWDLPKLSGFELLKRYRARQGQAPAIMLTAHSDVVDKELALDHGVDDYLTKPFDLRELSARVRAVLRRVHQKRTNVLEIGSLSLDTAAKRVFQRGKEVELLPKEYSLLEFLVRHPDQMFSPEELLDKVWNSDSDSSISAVRTVITRLRKKMGDTDEGAKEPLIQTVRGLGYRLNPPQE